MGAASQQATYRFEPDEVPGFTQASRRTKRRLRLLMTVLPLSSGRVLLTQDTTAEQVFVLLRGSADVTKDGEAINVLGPGDIVGEIGMLLDGVSTASVTLSEDAVVAMAYRDEFEAIVFADSELRRLVTTQAAQHLVGERDDA